MSNREEHKYRGFLSRLLHDARGNTIALVTACMIPLLGLVGGGVDMSRLYLTKTRLQQACDAGALAGRKAMGAGSWTTTGTGNSNGVALAMFAGNFQQGDYGTGTLTKTYTEANGTVTGAANAVVPMAVMRIFGITAKTLSVTCSAKMALPNTDVMFVLDTTGSMSQNIPGDTISKISGLKTAVKCFYEALMRVNTTEVCGNDPTASTYTDTAQIRIGFVPYSVNVNVGKLLPNSYLADSWNYQSRVGVYYTPGPPTGGSYNETATYSRSKDCNSWATGSDATGFPSDTTTPTSFTATTTTYTKVGYDSKTGICTRRVDQSSLTYTRDDTNGTYFHTWFYKQRTLTVSGLKAGGSSWNSSINLRVGDDGTYTDVSWGGCIEERQTVQNSDGTPSDEWSPIPSAAYDMNIDLVPSSTTGTQWGPLLNGAVWARYTPSSSTDCNHSTGNTTSDVTTSCDLSHNDYYVCPTAAKKLQTWTTASPFETYVNSLSPSGNTYHDIGMLWGARLISPTGIFASENTNLSNIQRHVIFMTDGDTNTDYDDYSAYGVHWWDRRQTTYAPTNTNLDNLVDARLQALCSAIKNQNITLWVISYGSVSGTTATNLQNCATSGKYYSASSSSSLIAQFQTIASAISQLRLTQ